MRPVVRLTASATSALPRWALLTICVVYAAFGLFDRDPWKNEDAAGFGVMWTMASGTWRDWLLPNLVGKPITTDGPLAYWVGASFIRWLDPLVDPSNASRLYTGLFFCMTCAFVWYGAYLLGRRPEVQPFKYAFGGEPLPRDYGRTLADGALLIVLGCFGLAERGHETTPQIAEMSAVAMLLYGLVRSLDKPLQGAAWTGVALGGIAFAGNPVLATALLVAIVATLGLVHGVQTKPFAVIAIPLALALGLAWPLAALWVFPAHAPDFLRTWFHGNFDEYSGPPSKALFYAIKNLPLFTWPAWPLAIWSWYSWGGLRRAPHVAIPMFVFWPLLVLVVLQSHQTNRFFMLLIPPLAVLAAFGLPTLKRGAINAIDWFAVLSFTILGSFVWLVWLASLTGFPHPLARNLARLVPGFQPEFAPLSFLCALVVTLGWIALVRWRISRQPKVIWRSVVLTSGGTTLMWVLLMTLWLPVVNYSRTYRDVATQIATHLPPDYACIRPVRLGNAQLATFAYFGNMRFAFSDEDCDVLLRQDTHDFSAPGTLPPYAWHLAWEGRRAADRDELFRLYVRVERLKTPPQRSVRRRTIQ
ncbi:glycosyltransferase family 39 protein [Mycetohabitans rhizoxinica]|uniref:Uncharacterized protein n=2 Tax=Mycetohabitans rhizoxinica TaxID=412963 RepID=E5AQG3_MYCRK|nr:MULTISPECIES: UDP phosphate-alpha-4-amino-4-deoxy-L-arabinose arabinosyl transferase [Mycetohabitans]MCF7695646.1 glycosyltransferase family 39 protein [Mycetohabitans sp. B2]MCG1046916.1 glycosyltransferase family 39 protein [Mycetohabitans sp. B6]CBW74845.1 Hypothetical protein RBRH_03758 [Mycetohabitans rhizoxinica HKI 454]